MARKRGRGSEMGLDGGIDSQALDKFDKRRHAKSTLESDKYRWHWWLRRCDVRGIPPMPVDAESFKLAGALLVQGGYNSGMQYLSTIKMRHIRAKHSWSDELAVIHKDAKRAIDQGCRLAAQF